MLNPKASRTFGFLKGDEASGAFVGSGPWRTPLRTLKISCAWPAGTLQTKIRPPTKTATGSSSEVEAATAADSPMRDSPAAKGKIMSWDLA